jgi:hypothetical protein
VTPGRIILAVALLSGWPLSSPAWEQLRLPWVFSDNPDLSADFSFEPRADGRTAVEIDLGGRFAGFGLGPDANRAPRLAIDAEFNAPGALEATPIRASTTVDLGEVLKEYGLKFSRSYFGASSDYVYKAQMDLALAPGDYHVALSLRDPGLAIESHRTLHLIVPNLERAPWAVGSFKFITAVGKRLDEKGHEQRVLDPNPWRQVGGKLGWDLMLAYDDRGSRPRGPLRRRHSIQRLRGDATPVWQEEGLAPAKKQAQVWLVRVPAATVRQWQAGVYLLKVELWAGNSKVEASKTFEVLP